jgi:hypothetical protein
MKPTRVLPSLFALVLGAVLVTLVPRDVRATTQGNPLGRFATHLSPEQLEILDHLSLVYLDDGQGGFTKTIRISGVNLQLVSGLGATNGNPSDPGSVAAGETRSNGLGNLIVGYNEAPAGGFDRTGSHFVVLGRGGSYSSFAGLASGEDSRVEAPYAVALGGAANRSTGIGAVALGGTLNEARGAGAIASGGEFNLAAGTHAAVTGGSRSLAGGDVSSVTGGYKSFALGFGAAVSGGALNRAEGNFSTVSGGTNRTVTGQYNWAAGSLFEGN